MSDKPLLQIAQQPAISPAEILRMAREDCSVWLELFFTETTTGSKVFGAFSEVIISMGEAVKKEGVTDGIKPFAELCLSMDKPIPTTGNRAANPDDKDLSAQIARRQEWLAKLADSQTEVEEKLEEADASLKEASDNLRFADKSTAKLVAEENAARDWKKNLEGFGGKLGTLRTRIQNEVETLQRYRRALDLVANGYPRESVGNDMPEIPSPPPREAIVTETITPAAETELPKSACSKAPEFSQNASLPNRRIHLRALAEDLGLLEIEVFIYSLFDLLAGKLPGKGSRGLKRVLSVAGEVGITGRYGWPNDAEEVLPHSGWKDGKNGTRIKDQGFLIYCGSPALGSPTYRRSDKPLPWNSKELFTEESADEFVRLISQKSVPQKKDE